MERLWCWRCEREVGLLDDDEYATIESIYYACMRRAKTQRSPEWDREEVRAYFVPARRTYAEMTGETDVEHEEIIKHRRSAYGPPCTTCGKPLRTPKASHCAECGAPR